MTMNVVRRRIRLGGSAVVTLGALLLVLLQVTAAHAATPVHFTFTETESFTDTTSCGFPIALNLQSKHVGTAFVDAQGNVQRIIVETNTVGTDSANGITLRERLTTTWTSSIQSATSKRSGSLSTFRTAG